MLSVLKRLARPVLAFVLLLQACSAEKSDAARDEFRLCEDDPNVPGGGAAIDFAALRGRSSDTARPISLCTDTESPCIDFPLLISAPPRVPDRPEDVVGWRNGNLRFGFRLLPGSPSNEDYVGEVLMVEPRPDGREATVGRWLYHYRTDEGVLTYRTTTEPYAMVRCGGRLTFDDLRTLTQRLPREATPWPPE